MTFYSHELSRVNVPYVDSRIKELITMVDSVCELLVFRDMQSKYSWREPRLV